MKNLVLYYNRYVLRQNPNADFDASFQSHLKCQSCQLNSKVWEEV